MQFSYFNGSVELFFSVLSASGTPVKSEHRRTRALTDPQHSGKQRMCLTCQSVNNIKMMFIRLKHHSNRDAILFPGVCQELVLSNKLRSFITAYPASTGHLDYWFCNAGLNNWAVSWSKSKSWFIVVFKRGAKSCSPEILTTLTIRWLTDSVNRHAFVIIIVTDCPPAECPASTIGPWTMEATWLRARHL